MRSRGNKDQSGLSYHLGTEKPVRQHAQSTTFGLLVFVEANLFSSTGWFYIHLFYLSKVKLTRIFRILCLSIRDLFAPAEVLPDAVHEGVVHPEEGVRGRAVGVGHVATYPLVNGHMVRLHAVTRRVDQLTVLALTQDETYNIPQIWRDDIHNMILIIIMIIKIVIIIIIITIIIIIIIEIITTWVWTPTK